MHKFAIKMNFQKYLCNHKILSSTSRFWVAIKDSGWKLDCSKTKVFTVALNILPTVPLMDRAAEELVESVIKTYVSVLIPPWDVCARALANNALLLHGCSPLPTALPNKQASPAQLCNYVDHLIAPAWLLVDHCNSCRAYTGQRWAKIASFAVLVQRRLTSVENKVQWSRPRCCSTLNQMVLAPLACGSFRWCPSWSTSSKSSVVNDSPAVKRFSVLRVWMFEF